MVDLIHSVDFKDCWQTFIGIRGLLLGMLSFGYIGNTFALFSVPGAQIIDSDLQLLLVGFYFLWNVYALFVSSLSPYFKPDSASPAQVRDPYYSEEDRLPNSVSLFSALIMIQSWLRPMQIPICELNHFPGLCTKHSIFINKDITVITLVDFGPGKSQPQ